MKRIALIFFIFAVCAIPCVAQACPAGQVCIDQRTANRYYKLADEYIALKDAYNKLLAERGASDATIAAANKLLADYEQLMSVRNDIDAKKDALIAIYQKTIDLYAALVEKLEARINAPRSSLQKFLSVLKEAALIALGVSIGKGL